MHILMVTQWFDPEPAFKGMPFARALMAEGHTVQVITGFPNYPGGKLYPGYKVRAHQREIIDGVVVDRVPLYPSHNTSAVERIATYASYAASSALFGALIARRPDIIYGYHPPLTTALSACLIGAVRRVPVVADIQDLWPDSLTATGMLNNERALGIVDKVCSGMYAQVARIVVLSPGFKARLLAKGVPAAKVDVIYNWCSESDIAANGAGPAPKSMEGRFNVVFAGNMGRAQALDKVIVAASIVWKQNPNVQFVFVGDGVETARLKEMAAGLSPGNVVFLPRMPMSEVGSVLSAADVLLVNLSADKLFEIAIPSKTQAYMAAGRPILMAARGDAADLVEKADAGLVVPPEDYEALAAAVLKMSALSSDELRAFGVRGKEYYRQELSMKAGVDRFLQVFREVSGRA